MDEDEYFRRLMESAGVAPLDPAAATTEAMAEPAAVDQPRRRSTRRSEPVDEADARLFESAMRDLDTRPLDASLGEPLDAAPGDTGRAPAARSPRRVRPRKKDLRVDERIDLHRCTAEEAAKRLEQALAAARAAARTLLVVTGKGLHSPGGVPVLRQRVEEWLRRHGRRHGVEAYSEAPRALGGRGAFILYFRRSG
jgi:DNA-nicking Smr family endonuclease